MTSSLLSLQILHETGSHIISPSIFPTLTYLIDLVKRWDDLRSMGWIHKHGFVAEVGSHDAGQ